MAYESPMNVLHIGATLYRLQEVRAQVTSVSRDATGCSSLRVDEGSDKFYELNLSLLSLGLSFIFFESS